MGVGEFYIVWVIAEDGMEAGKGREEKSRRLSEIR